MACCVLGAVIFGTLFALWSKIKSLFGIKEETVNHVATWTLADSINETTAPAQPRPFIAPRFAALLMLVSVSLAGGYFLVAHGDHLLTEISCFMESSDAACGNETTHQHHH